MKIQLVQTFVEVKRHPMIEMPFEHVEAEGSIVVALEQSVDAPLVRALSFVDFPPQDLVVVETAVVHAAIVRLPVVAGVASQTSLLLLRIRPPGSSTFRQVYTSSAVADTWPFFAAAVAAPIVADVA